MELSLVHNPNAGGASAVETDALENALVEAGHRVRRLETATVDDLDRALERPGDAVVAAGGDGTVRAVATRLAGRGVPLAVIPMGTANNVAAALGLRGSPLEIAAGLAAPVPRPLDVGVARGPWGEWRFLEAAGTGLFASTMAAYGPDDGKSLPRALAAILGTVPGFAALGCEARLDGEDLSGRYVLLEAMNTPALGPRLRLAPAADPGDGLLAVVTFEEHDRVGFAQYVAGLVAGNLEALPNVTVRSGRRLEVVWPEGAPLHLDAEVERPEAGARVEFALEAGALTVLLPAPPEALEAPAAALAGGSA